MTKPLPNPADAELIPEFIETQLPSGTRVQFCFDEPLLSSDAGLLLLADHLKGSGDIARVAAALAPKLKAATPGNGVRKRGQRKRGQAATG
ncbi:MAG: hypothetical protein K1X78_27125 [Verrucomicrobiaceae bacterium]|nr:hypothetical protein [Verrucomicrobiaceae bacterium]